MTSNRDPHKLINRYLRGQPVDDPPTEPDSEQPVNHGSADGGAGNNDRAIMPEPTSEQMSEMLRRLAGW